MLQEALKACILADRVPYLEGAPGLGKSAMTRQLAAAFGVRCVVEYLGQKAGNEIHGIPVIRKEPLTIGDREFTIVEQAPPGWAVEAATAPEGALVFLDELNQLSPPDFGQVMSILSERMVGRVPLPRESVGLVGAGNPPELSAGGWRIPLPARRRIVKVDMKVDMELFSSPQGFSSNWANDFGRGPRPKYGSEENAEASSSAGGLTDIRKFGRVIAREDRHRKRTLLASWVHANPTCFHLPPDLGQMYDGWVSPATLEDAADLLASVDAHVAAEHRNEVRGVLLCGALGSAGAGDILTYLDNLDVPDSRLVLDDPTQFVRSDSIPQPDKLYYFLMSLVEEMRFRTRASLDRPNQTNVKRAQGSWYNGLEVAAYLNSKKAPADMICMLVGNFVAPDVKPKQVVPPPIVDKLAPLLATMRAAGVSWVRLAALKPGADA